MHKQKIDFLKNQLKLILLFLLVAIIVQSCSRKKDAFINRAWHSVGTEYNILFNGENALQQGLASVNDAFTENFWELLPVERLVIKDEARLGNEANNADFERAEEKATKAIQKHSMTIGGKEKNPQIDEAYLLLGKARYYDQRFVPALAAFNNIMNKYPTSDKINQVKVWREKTNLRLGSPELAIKNLKRHLKQEDVEGQDLADISAVLAEAYLALKHKDTALKYLDTAAVATKINYQKARYNFIRGQLYDEFGKKDSANMAYDIIIEMHRKIPRAFYINAHLAKSFNFDTENGDKLAFTEYLTELEENRENRPFLDKIYHRIAKYHQGEGKDSLAESYYNKSLRKTQGDQTLNARNYLILGDMYFDRTEYKTAGAYYDSTLTNMVAKTKPYRVVEKKRKNLDDVIFYEGIARENDSILNITSLPKEEQIAVYLKHIEKLKKQDSIADELEKKRAQKLANKNTGEKGNLPGFASNRGIQPVGVSQSGGGNTDFYFYNQTTVSYGKNEFLRLWGQRKLQDNWRLSDITDQSGSEGKDTETVIASATQLERYDPEFYIKTLPTEKKVLDSLNKERNFAYYQLGLIYKEKFKEYELAKSKLEVLLTNNPEERLILPSKYYLYKLYVLLGQDDEAEIAKQRVINEHPDSRYAEILRNPQSQLARDENSAESVYEKLYLKFENQEYATVISEAEKNIKLFEGDAFVPKFEILKASASGRLYGFEAYKEGVNYIALTYPNSEEGKHAQLLLQNAIPALAKAELLPQEEGVSFNVLFQFNNGTETDIEEFTKELEKIANRIPYAKLKISKDIYNTDNFFIVVHGFESFIAASTFDQKLNFYKDEESEGITKAYIPISNHNYTVVQRHKTLDKYTANSK